MIKLSTIENVKFLIDALVVLQKDLDQVETLCHERKTTCGNQDELDLFRHEVETLFNLPGNRLSIIELSALLPERFQILSRQRGLLLQELDSYGVKIDCDGKLQMRSKDAKDVPDPRHGVHGFVKR